MSDTPDDWAKVSVREMELPRHLKNALLVQLGSWATAGDLAERSDRELLRLRQVSRWGLAQIRLAVVATKGSRRGSLDQPERALEREMAKKNDPQVKATEIEPGAPTDPFAGGAVVAITPPKFETLHVGLYGTAPYMQARFSEKAKRIMREKMLQGSQAKKGKQRDARDFDDDYRQAMYLFGPPSLSYPDVPAGSHGIPAHVFRNACISACRIIGFKMTLAKLSLFVSEDGFDVVDGVTPLVWLHGTPEKLEMATRNATGVADIRVRPCWKPGWWVKLRVRYDTGIFKDQEVVNLLARVGAQVGIGEGRPDSKASAGLGYGLFDVMSVDALDAKIAEAERKAA